MAGQRQVFLDETLSSRMDRDETDLVTLALDPEVLHALSIPNISHPQPAQLLASHTVIEQSGEHGAIAHALERGGSLAA